METVIIAGGTGMLGTSISHLLRSEGYKPIILTRDKKKSQQQGHLHWDVKNKTIDTRMNAADHIINLAGVGIADARWSAEQKKKIISSRVESSLLLADWLKHSDGVKTYINASAVGYYGDAGDRLLTEKSDKGSDFLSDVCQQWEDAARHAQPFAERWIVFRIGVVLSKRGGALAKMDATIPMGIASYLGDGHQYVPWIHIHDLAAMMVEGLKNAKLNGIYNATSTHSVPQKEFMRTLRNVKNPIARLIPVPAFALKLSLGEMSSVVLNSTNVSAQKITEAGFRHQYTDLEDALRAIYQK